MLGTDFQSEFVLRKTFWKCLTCNEANSRCSHPFLESDKEWWNENIGVQ